MPWKSPSACQKTSPNPLGAAGGNLSRHALEALAVEGYRTGALTETQVRRLLGLETRFEVHALLKEHKVPLHPSLHASRSGRGPRLPPEPRNPLGPMIVVADSGPLHYLILLEQTDLLSRFYGQVVISSASEKLATSHLLHSLLHCRRSPLPPSEKLATGHILVISRGPRLRW